MGCFWDEATHSVKTKKKKKRGQTLTSKSKVTDVLCNQLPLNKLDLWPPRFPSPATSQHRPAPPAGGKHHAAARGSTGPQRQGSIPARRHQGRTHWRRGEEREHGRRLHGGEGVSGGEREEPPVGRRGRQQRGRSQTDGREERGHRGLDPAHGSGYSVQGTAPTLCAAMTHRLKPALHLASFLQHIKSLAGTKPHLTGSEKQITESQRTKVQPFSSDRFNVDQEYINLISQ